MARINARWLARGGLRRLGLSMHEGWVLLALIDRADKDGISWPSQLRIAADLGIARSTVQDALSQLREVGAVHEHEPGRPGDRPAIGSEISRVNLPDRRAGWSPRTCPSHGAGWHRDTCPPAGHEDRTTHVPRSSELEHPVNTTSHIGRLAGRCPSGEEAQREVRLEARQPDGRRVSEWSRSCPLPRALAGDDEQSGGWVSSLAACRRHGASAWRFPARVQYARGGARGRAR